MTRYCLVPTSRPGPASVPELCELAIRREAPAHQICPPNWCDLQCAGVDRYIGLIVAFAGGGVYAFFAPAFNVATNDNFGLLAPGVPPLSIYATDFYFAAGFTGISLVRPPIPAQASALLRLWWNDQQMHGGSGSRTQTTIHMPEFGQPGFFQRLYSDSGCRLHWF